MREHFYTYPTVVELRADRDRAPVPGGAGAERSSPPPVAGNASSSRSPAADSCVPAIRP